MSSRDCNSKNNHDNLDFAGIGIGPFNLGLAALLKPVKSLKYKFFEQNPNFTWHKELLLCNSKLQVHYLKDLVTCVDPTSEYSFLSYLVHHNRIYEFLNRKTSVISRLEYSDYLAWVATQMPHFEFNCRVEDFDFDKTHFLIHTARGTYRSKHLVLGIGMQPNIAKQFRPHLSATLFHSSSFLSNINKLNLQGKRVMVLGGGQSGAEIFEYLIGEKEHPKSISWITSRLNFRALEDNSFVNEFYTPRYIKYFYNLPQHIKQLKLEQLKLTSDGITQELADNIYNQLYEIKHLQKKDLEFELIVGQTVTGVAKNHHGYTITAHDHDHETTSKYKADIIILATGYKTILPQCLKDLLPEMSVLDNVPIREDYSLDWEYADKNNIYFQNAAKHTHGIADPNLSLASWRNSVIINSICKREVYNANTDQFIIGRKTAGTQHFNLGNTNLLHAINC
jgi:lysine N6-hydroxylase